MSERSMPTFPVKSVSVKPKKSLKQILQQHPLVTFFVVAYTISWLALVGIFMGDTLNSQASQLPVSFLVLAILSSYGPALAALFMRIIGSKRSDLNRQNYQLLSWRISFRWYLVTLLLPAAIVFTGAALAVLLNNGSIALQIPSVFVIYLVVINLGEELGWRGFALPRLLERYNALTASIILGVLWAMWHLPLHITAPLYFAFYIVYVVAMSIIMTWIFINTKGSLMLMLIFHWSINSVLYFFQFTPALEQPLTMGVTAVIMSGVAGGLLWRYGPHLTNRQATSSLKVNSIRQTSDE